MNDLNRLSLDELFRTLVTRNELDALVQCCRSEDLGDIGDVTTNAIIPSSARTTIQLVARNHGKLSGMAAAPAFIHAYDAQIAQEVHKHDGDHLAPGDIIATYTGSTRAILALERPLLNLIGHLSGIATMTSSFVTAVDNKNVAVCDTRKTTPGLRKFEKYAVKCGGGHLHRIGLHDAVLIKDNHLAGLEPHSFASNVACAAREARAAADIRFVEVEVDTLEQCRALMEKARDDIDIILLDNMTIKQLEDAVQMRNQLAPDIHLEASGGINLDTVHDIAATGVNRISVGAITHSAPALDLGFDATEQHP